MSVSNCAICKKKVQEAPCLQYEHCKLWIHQKCIKLDTGEMSIETFLFLSSCRLVGVTCEVCVNISKHTLYAVNANKHSIEELREEIKTLKAEVGNMESSESMENLIKEQEKSWAGLFKKNNES